MGEMGGASERPLNLVSIALRQRDLHWVAVCQMILYPLSFVLAFVEPAVWVILVPANLILIFVGIIVLLRLLSLLRVSFWVYPISVCFMFGHMIGWLMMYSASLRATDALKRVGIVPGKMGISKADLEWLKLGCPGNGVSDGAEDDL